jgi:hypothetical protein
MRMTMEGRQRTVRLLCCGWLLLVPLSATARSDEIDEALAVLARSGPQAAGSIQARAAAEQLAAQGPHILPRLLLAMDTSNVVAANWCRTAYEQIVDRELPAANREFPAEALQQFVRDARHGVRPRRLALALLDQLDPDFRRRMMPQWLEDGEFRSDAVAFALQQGDQAQREKRTEHARESYHTAFRHARDSDQVLAAVTRLKSAGVEVNPIDHMGFLTRWYLVGPFDAPGTSGFHESLPPESAADPESEYDDGGGRKLRWNPYRTEDVLGEVNLIQAIAPVKEAVAYAYAEIDSPSAQTVQLRCSADDNLSVWLNGRQVLAREQWLNGTRLDRFITSVELEQGRNRVLVKVCQGPKHVNPEVPNNWSFQLRFCDESGGAVGVRTLRPQESETAQQRGP